MRKQELKCPFCENLLARPAGIDTGTLDITGGICQCSAVYLFDQTGHNLGQMLMDALAFACKEDYDKALSLTSEEYITEVLDYNPQTNTASLNQNVKAKSPKLFFLKLKGQ